jgi:hypothetical protein
MAVGVSVATAQDARTRCGSEKRAGEGEGWPDAYLQGAGDRDDAAEARRKPESRKRICRRLEAMERNQQLTYASSIIHLAIAIASISIPIHRRWLWAASLDCLAA